MYSQYPLPTALERTLLLVLTSQLESLMVAVLCYLVHLFFILSCGVLPTPSYPLDLILGPAGSGINAVLDNTFDFVSVTFWSFSDRTLECDSTRGKFSIIISEPGF